MINCRGCSAKLSLTFLDLGMSPIANSLIDAKQLNQQNKVYPLRVMTCEECALVQLSEAIPREILFPSSYAYYSSYSSTWLQHSRTYTEKMISLLRLNQNDFVVEIASNDGYLLQYFAQRNIQVLGIEPASGVAKIAITRGIRTQIDYFGESTAVELSKRKKPRLIVGNNVLAHVPDIHDFIKGVSILIADEGIISFEFPHLLNLIKNNQFDTIYHEHYSYLSVSALLPIFAQYGLKVINVEKLLTHGGSIRLFVAKNISNWEVHASVQNVIDEELQFDPRDSGIYESLQRAAEEIKNELLSEIMKFKKAGKNISAYGAAAKGVTLLNYCGIGNDLIDYVIDLNPNKQGKFLPGSEIPIVDINILNRNCPDILLVLPWNLSVEIKSQLSPYLKLGVKIMRAIPKVEFF